jgi:hypothetical protein
MLTVLVSLLLLVVACAAQMRLDNLTHIVFLIRPFFASLGLDQVVDVAGLDVACPAQAPRFFWCDANGTITVNVTSTGASGDVALGFFSGQPIRRIFAANNSIQTVTFGQISNLLDVPLGKTLSEVDLSSNNISTWPVEFDTLPFTHFDISRNRLDGPVPDLKNWSKIVECTLMDAENETNTLCRPTCNPEPAVCFRNVPLCAGVVCVTATTLSNVTLATTAASGTTAASDATTAASGTTAASDATTTATPTTQGPTSVAVISRTTERLVKPIIDDSDTLPLIIGLSIGAAFAAIVIGIALACVFREKKKNKQLEVAYSPPLATSLQADTQTVSEGTEFAKPNKVVAVYDVVGELLPAEESHYTRAPSPGPDVAVSPTGEYGRAPAFPSSGSPS